MSSDNQKNSTKYDLVAHLYSFITGFLFIFGGLTEGRMRNLAYKEILHLAGNERILDICCANGNGTRIIASMVPNGKVFGIDLNPSMIAFAHSKSEGQSNIAYRVGNCAKIPFPDNSFDVVTAALALHELPTSLLKSVFAELRRVLKPNGFLYVFDFTLPKKRSKYFRLIYSILRLVEDDSAARFMMVDQKKLFKREKFSLIHQKRYYSGLLTSSLYKLVS